MCIRMYVHGIMNRQQQSSYFENTIPTDLANTCCFSYITKKTYTEAKNFTTEAEKKKTFTDKTE